MFFQTDKNLTIRKERIFNSRKEDLRKIYPTLQSVTPNLVMLPSFQHCWLLNVLRIYRYIWCAVLFLSDTFIFDPSFHCSQETQGNKTPQNKGGSTRKSCILSIQLFLKNTKERLPEKTTQQQLPLRTLEASALLMVFAMSLYAEQWNCTVQMKPARSAQNSSTCLRAPQAH